MGHAIALGGGLLSKNNGTRHRVMMKPESTADDSDYKGTHGGPSPMSYTKGDIR
jgi:hypothetical protein